MPEHFTSLTAAPLLADLSGALFALGVALMLVILLRRSGRYVHQLKRRARKASRQPSAKTVRREEQMANMFDRASPLLDAPATVVRWQVEMQELARELKAEVDTKLCLLQVLVARANEAAERLEVAADRAERLGCRPDSAEASAVSATLESLAADAAETRPAKPAIPPYSDRVYRLADAGDNASEIADQIGLPLGDVEFVLSLRPQSGETV